MKKILLFPLPVYLFLLFLCLCFRVTRVGENHQCGDLIVIGVIIIYYLFFCFEVKAYSYFFIIIYELFLVIVPFNGKKAISKLFRLLSIFFLMDTSCLGIAKLHKLLVVWFFKLIILKLYLLMIHYCIAWFDWKLKKDFISKVCIVCDSSVKSKVIGFGLGIDPTKFRGQGSMGQTRSNWS